MAAAFCCIAVLLVGGLVALLVRPLLRAGDGKETSRAEENAAIYRAQLAELDAERAAGEVSEAEYAESRAEIERRVLEEAQAREDEPRLEGRSVGTAIAIGVFVPVCAAALYWTFGNPDAFDAESYVARQTHEEHSSALSMQAAIDQLKERLKEDPENGRGWLMLAHASAQTEDFKAANEAFERATKLLGENADTLADWADALAMLQNRSIEGRPLEMINRALELDPKQWKALAMLGTYHFDRKDYAKAVEYWERLLEILPPDSEAAARIDGSIDEACALGNIKRKARAEMPPAGFAGGATVSGTVTISEAAKADCKPKDTVFIYAIPATGSKMPLSFTRVRVEDLPYKFTLVDMSELTGDGRPGLGKAGQVTVVARVSKKGEFRPYEGDYEGQTAKPVAVGAEDVAIEIATRVVVEPAAK